MAVRWRFVFHMVEAATLLRVLGETGNVVQRLRISFLASASATDAVLPTRTRLPVYTFPLHFPGSGALLVFLFTFS